MSIKQLNPYLNFDGTAAKAIQHYERALGAKTEGLQRFGDMPGSDEQGSDEQGNDEQGNDEQGNDEQGSAPPPEHASRVLHAVLRIGAGLVMISDTQPDTPFTAGSNVHLCLDFDDPQEMAGKFDALGAGGRVTMPLQDTFWGARFGLLTDAYGINWMFNCNLPRGAEKG